MPRDELTPLPSGDTDAELARRIGEGKGPSDRDAFERLLSAYRDRARELVPPPELVDRLWERIRPAARQETGLRRVLPSWTRWAAAAAAVVLIAFALWIAHERAPTLVTSSSASITAVALDDGSTVTLRPHSALYRRDKRRYLLEGEAFFDVLHDPKEVFRVETNTGEVRVLGTRFDVSTWGDETVVFLEHGRLAFRYTATGVVDTLSPGDRLVASISEHRVDRAHGAEGALDWMNEVLVFDARPLSRIIAEMEHHFRITVLVPDSLKNETLSGQVYLSSPEQSLRDLGTALGGRFEKTEPDVFRLTFD